MNATNLYLSTCRLVMQADPDNRESYAELYKLLPYLRQSLTCTVCGRILSEPYTPTETSCQHHVCKVCIGGKKRLKPSCSWCKDYETYIENSQMRVIIRCYKKLCSYVKTTCLYKKLSSIINNGGSCSLTDIIDEALAEESASVSGLAMGLIIDHCDLKTSMETNNVNCDVEPADIENINNKIILMDNDLKIRDSVSPLLTVDSSVISPLIETCSHLVSSPISILSETPISSFCEPKLQSPPLPLPPVIPPVAELPLPISPVAVATSNNSALVVTSIPTMTAITTIPASVESKFNCTSANTSIIVSPTSDKLTFIPMPSTSSNISRSITRVHNSISIPITSTISSTSLTQNENMLPYGLSVSANVAVSLHEATSVPSEHIKLTTTGSSFSQPPSVINTVMSPIELSTLPTIFNVPPGTILSSTNMKQSVRESLLKYGSSLNNGSSMYSVMYNDNESTKITIKRKPPDIENVKKLPLEKDKHIIIPSQEIIKKPKPKPKPKPKRKGCRCGNATPTPGKLTCCGQRCPCYVEAKACIECQCRGCRNPHRPGGKKVRPVIPQLGNIQIHQIQPVHSRMTAISASHTSNTIHPVSVSTMSTQTPIMTTSGSTPQAIRTVHAMHTVQTVHGLSHIHAIPASGVHQLINIGSGMMDSALTSGLNTDITLKPVNFALSSIPAQLLINDDKSTSNSASDDSDVEIDI